MRWGVNPDLADHICCNQHHGAEHAGYWLTTSFPTQLPDGETITFYDVTSGLPLFNTALPRLVAGAEIDMTSV